MRVQAVRSMYTCRPCSASIVLRVAADDDLRRSCNVMLKLSRCIPQCDVRLKQSVFCRIRGGADTLNVRCRRKVAKSNGFFFWRGSADYAVVLPLFYRFHPSLSYPIVSRYVSRAKLAAADEEVVRTYS